MSDAEARRPGEAGRDGEMRAGEHDAPSPEEVQHAMHADPPPGKKPNPVRRLYDWVLSWAERPGGTWALFGISFAEASFFPIPPDPLLIALALGKPSRSLWFALVCTLGSLFGGIAGYLIGMGLWGAVEPFFMTYVPGVTPESFERVQVLYDRYDFWAIFAAGFTPLPYKVFSLSSGVFHISFPIFVIATILSRGARFFLVAGLIWKFGPPIQGFIDKYFDKLAILFLLLLVGGFVVIELLL